MAVSPDDRFAGLLNSSAERGGWVPGDIFASDTEGTEEPIAPRRTRLPIIVTLIIVALGMAVIGYFLFRPSAKNDIEPASGAATVAPSSEAQADTGSASGSTDQAAGQSSGQSSNQSGNVVVHVTGQVENPSVVTLTAGSRVADAVEKAGGLGAEADAEAVNLARVLKDGEQIHIPARGEEPRPVPDSGGKGAAAGAPDGGSAGTEVDGAANATGTSDSGAGGTGGKIDLNTADSTMLQTLPGIGPVTAEAIITHRETQAFASVDDLLLVDGIGPKTFEKLKDHVTVG